MWSSLRPSPCGRLRPPEDIAGLRESVDPVSATASTLDQMAVEDNCLCLFRHSWNKTGGREEEVVLQREQTMQFLVRTQLDTLRIYFKRAEWI